MEKTLKDLTKKRNNALYEAIWGNMTFWQERKDAIDYDDFGALQEYVGGAFIYTDAQIKNLQKEFEDEKARKLCERSLQDTEIAFADYIGYLGC